ncbi:MAG: rod shape-determining protein MreD [Terriglobales bacterium]
MPTLYTSGEQVEVYRFPPAVSLGIPLLAIFFQAFVPVRLRFFSIFDLPLLVTIFFAVARRNPIMGLLTGGIIGLLQDSLSQGAIGVFGIAKTVVGYGASSLGVKLDVDNPGSRIIMTFLFYILHQLLWLLITRGMMGETHQLQWGRLMLAAFANGFLAVPVFSALDKFKQRV